MGSALPVDLAKGFYHVLGCSAVSMACRRAERRLQCDPRLRRKLRKERMCLPRAQFRLGQALRLFASEGSPLVEEGFVWQIGDDQCGSSPDTGSLVRFVPGRGVAGTGSQSIRTA
jgi:hypothetical protein